MGPGGGDRRQPGSKINYPRGAFPNACGTGAGATWGRCRAGASTGATRRSRGQFRGGGGFWKRPPDSTQEIPQPVVLCKARSCELKLCSLLARASPPPCLRKQMAAEAWLSTGADAAGGTEVAPIDDTASTAGADCSVSSVGGIPTTAGMAVSDAVFRWVTATRPYLPVVELPQGRRGVQLDAVLAPGDNGMTILHQMIDGLRDEAKRRHQTPEQFDPSKAVPWDVILNLPNVGMLCDRRISDGRLTGKTALCMLANQCMQGRQYADASKAICRWLLEHRASPDLRDQPDKCPLMLAAGSVLT